MGMVTGSGNSAIHQLFSYDSSGNVVSVDYSSNGGSTFTTYYYLRNAQNDFVKLIDSNGNTVVQYTYDSWGKPISTTGSLSATLGTNQPFRYRGYVYDTETGWYYLQSRYYDPSVGRFVSADVLLSTGQGVIGHNSYAYCLNNPIRYMDEGGESAAEALSWWTTTMWWLTAIDGPIPAGDIIYAVVMLVLGVATATASAPAISIPKAEEKEESEVITKDPGSPVIFPVNPYDFNPLGLVRVYRPGTKNGALISWMDPVLNIEVFRWDENTNHPNGPHYHIYGSGHYEPGKDKVPEPFASIYFPFHSMN